MAELGAIAKAFADYGAWAFVALCCIVIGKLYAAKEASQNARIADFKEVILKSVESDKDDAHAKLQAAEALKALERRIEMQARP
jgi:hypothetical protein